jgi:hypothetical protein
MRRVAIGVGIGLMCLVMVAVATLIVVRVATYDGRSPMEKFEDEAGKPAAVSLASCPPHVPRERSLPDRNDRQPDAVVPNGAIGILLCRYYGFGSSTASSYERQGKLAREGGVGGPPVVPEVVREFQDSKRLTGSGVTACPDDSGERMLAIFRYRREPPVPVEVNLGGCSFAGASGRPGIAVSGRLVRRLESFVVETLGALVPPEDSP